MNATFTEYHAWKIKRIEALQYDKLMEAAGKNSADYAEIRANWLTAHYAMQYFAGLFPDIMKRVWM